MMEVSAGGVKMSNSSSWRVDVLLSADGEKGDFLSGDGEKSNSIGEKSESSSSLSSWLKMFLMKCDSSSFSMRLFILGGVDNIEMSSVEHVDGVERMDGFLRIDRR